MSRHARLFACALARTYRDLLKSKDIWAIEIAEAWADGYTKKHMLDEAHEWAVKRLDEVKQIYRQKQNEFFPMAYGRFDGEKRPDLKPFIEQRNQARRLRDMYMEIARCTRTILTHNNDHSRSVENIFDALWRDYYNEFLQVEPATQHLSQECLGIAKLIYDEKDWESLRILADKLDDEGYQTTAVQRHLRRVQNPQRGIWSLDYVLGLYEIPTDAESERP